MMQFPSPTSPETPSPPRLDIDGARATIRLNRPKHLNRLQAEDLDALLRLFERIEADPAIRVLVLTGTGRAFSAGYDLGSIAELATSDQEQTAGTAFGVDTAEMFMPAARLGLHYYKSGIRRYVSRLGVDNAKKLFLTAEKIDAPEMLRIGYLTAMVPVSALDEEVERLARGLAANAPAAMRGMKRTINEIARGQLDEAAADRRHRDSMRGAEIAEGIKAYAEKRPPKF
jgi:enoyl-CoA hydratase